MIPQNDRAKLPGSLFNTAVLFLVFNRPDVAEQVFAAIRQAKPPRLYVVADGPRSNRPGEAEMCARVRRIATAIDWDCEVKTLFRDRNLGCKHAVSSGISWFFEHEEEGIILEDDCLPDRNFFQFCQELLEKYRQDTRISMIAGTNLSSRPVDTEHSYLFSRMVQIWGWATWRRAWQLYDRDMTTWPEFEKNNGFGNLGIHRAISEYVTKSFWRVYHNQTDTWDYQWSYCVISNSMYVVVPKVNMIRNIGLGKDATHTLQTNGPYADLQHGEMEFPLRHPKQIIPVLAYDLEKVSHATTDLAGRVIRKIKRGVKKIRSTSADRKRMVK
jgi:hypothetical protein